MKEPVRKQMSAILAAVVMALPALVVIHAAVPAAADNVPIADGEVPWKDVRNLKSVLYFKRTVGQPDPGNPGGTIRHPMDTLAPARGEGGVSPNAASTSYGVIGGNAVPLTGTTAQIRSVPLTHEVNITGDNALTVVWNGQWAEPTPLSSGLVWTVSVKSQGSGAAEAGNRRVTDQADDDDIPTDPCRRLSGGSNEVFIQCIVAVPLKQEHRGRFTFRQGANILVEISAEMPAGGLPFGAPTTWSLRTDDAARPSFLEFRSENAIKVAAWTADRDSRVTQFFRPNYDPRARVYNHVDAFFSVKSAFGSQDLVGRDQPRYNRPYEPKGHVLYKGNLTPYPITLANLTTIDLRHDPSNSTADHGMITYRFPKGVWDVGKWPFPTGEFKLQMEVPFRSEDLRQTASLKADWDFVISTQQLSLRPYDDDDDRTQPSPLERADHELAPGGSTTFLVLVRNQANFADNVTLTAELQASSPTFGWNVAIGGEKVVGGNRVPLGPNEETLVTVTVTAPATAANGNAAVYRLRAHSTVDLNSRSEIYSIIATVSSAVREDAGLIVTKSTEKVRPGQDNLITAYLWNRGTRPANLTMSLKETETAGWNVTLLRQGLEAKNVTVPSVPAGGLAAVQLRVRPDPQLSVGTDHRITLNGTLDRSGASGMEKEILFTLTSLASFRVELLRGINADAHYLEMACRGAAFADPENRPPVACLSASNKQDALPGTWFRAWITNTGDVADSYDLAIKNPSEPDAPDPERGEIRSEAFYPVGPNLAIGVRAPDGRFSPRSAVDNLGPGQTAEVYVWVGHKNDTSRYQENRFNFDLSVQSRLTKQELRRIATAIGEDADNAGAGDTTRKTAIKLEHVERLPEYFAGDIRPLVRVENANLRSLTKFVDLSGLPTTFYVRVTNGASWRSFIDGETNRHYDSQVSLSIDGAEDARQKGWNITMRPRTGIVDERLNPWKETLNVSNFATQNGRWEGFFDREIEIQVRPPLNGSGRVVAEERRAFTLHGIQSGLNTAVARSTLEFIVAVSPHPNITMAAEVPKEFVHPGGQTAFTLFLANNGSVAAPVTIRPRITEDTPRANLWSVTQANLNLTAHENRTLALIVGAPADAVPGDPAVVNVTLSFPRFPGDPNSPRIERHLELQVEVRAPSTLRLTPVPTAMQASPGGIANFTFEVRNTGSNDVRFEARATTIPNWSASRLPSGTLAQVGQVSRFAYLLELPTHGVLRDSSYQSVVKVQEVGNPDNFDIKVVTVNVIGGQPFPLVQAVRAQDLIQRDGTTKFEMGVKNLGNTGGNFPLEAKAVDTRWQAWAEDESGRVITTIQVNPNELKRVFLAVKAPANVPEGTVMPVTLTAFNSQADRSSSGTVRAIIHDYGVDVDVRPSRVDVVSGDSVDLTVRVTNLGNGNDTVLLTPDLMGLSDWSMEFGSPSLNLLAGASTDVRLVIRSPLAPLPTPRTYTMSVVGASQGGDLVGVAKTDSSPFVVTVLNYRGFDVDGDGLVELAVDRNKRSSDGFEHFREIHRDGVQTREVDNLSGKEDGRITFLLDVPVDGAYDGVADLYFDPNDLFVYRIEYTPDINGDGTPNYLLDTDNDGVVDAAWDTATRQLWRVTTIFAFGGLKPQFLVDTNRDGIPDRYYDPERNVVTRTIPQQDNRIGIDTDGSGRARKLFDVNSGTVTDATVSSVGGFAREYWYFFAGFALVLVVFGLVLAKRRRLAP